MYGAGACHVSGFWSSDMGEEMEDHPQPSGFNSNQGNLFILKSDEILIICNVADYKMLPSSQ